MRLDGELIRHRELAIEQSLEQGPRLVAADV
jgi:hypothetical protein